MSQSKVWIVADSAGVIAGAFTSEWKAEWALSKMRGAKPTWVAMDMYASILDIVAVKDQWRGWTITETTLA